MGVNRFCVKFKWCPRPISEWLSGNSVGRSDSSLTARRPPRLLVVRKHQAALRACVAIFLEVVDDPGSSERPTCGRLTPREAEVSFWIERAKSNLEIAQILDIAPATVSKHLEHIYEKLGVENRTAAANTCSRIRSKEYKTPGRAGDHSRS